jgi:hypothetical protein
VPVNELKTHIKIIHTTISIKTRNAHVLSRKQAKKKITSVDVMPAQAPAASLPNTVRSPSLLRKIF